MTRKEIIEKVLAILPEEKKEAFIKEMTACRDLAEKADVLEQYGITLTEEEKEAFTSNKISDEDLDEAAGGGCCVASCNACYLSIPF